MSRGQSLGYDHLSEADRRRALGISIVLGVFMEAVSCRLRLHASSATASMKLPTTWQASGAVASNAAIPSGSPCARSHCGRDLRTGGRRPVQRATGRRPRAEPQAQKDRGTGKRAVWAVRTPFLGLQPLSRSDRRAACGCVTCRGPYEVRPGHDRLGPLRGTVHRLRVRLPLWNCIPKARSPACCTCSLCPTALTTD